jgi:hypothetical protein
MGHTWQYRGISSSWYFNIGECPLLQSSLDHALTYIRLGVLGFLPPVLAGSSGDPNLGLLDVVNGLKAISWYIRYLGGDSTKVTVGGQSSGAGMIRSQSNGI